MGYRKSYPFPFASYPAVRIMLLMVLGITIVRFQPLQISAALSVFAAVSIAWVLFEFILRKKFAVLSSHGSAILYSMLVVAASIVLITLQDKGQLDRIEQSKPVALFEWEDLLIKGEIIDAGKSSSGRDVFTVDVNETSLPNGMKWKQNYKIRLYGGGNTIKPLTEGSSVEGGIRLYEFPERRNPHEFDYGAWLHSQGISAHGELQSIINSENNGWFGWGNFRGIVLRNIDELFNNKEASLAKALLLGYKDDLTPGAKQQFSRAGLSHIMAVSGLHVGFIVAPFWLMIPFLWKSKRRKWTGMMVLTLMLLGYAGLTGFSASVCRASLMAWLLTYGRLFHKIRNSMNLTALAAIILLLINPAQLFDAGFQLSFCAVFIILLVMPEAKRLLPQKFHFGWIGGLMTIILVSIVVQLGLFPILITYFGEFSLAGPLSNALVVPVLTIVVPAGLTIVLMSPVMPLISQAAVIPLDFTLQWISTVASFAGGSSYSFITLNNTSITLFSIWLFAIFAVASIRIPKVRWKMVICLLLAMNVFVLEKVIEKSKPEKLEITFLDVGQGDAIHIKTPGGKHLLVDTGRWSPFGNSGEDVLLPYFDEKGINRLDAVILSHPHADHIGGVADILQTMPADTIYQSDYEYDSSLYETYMKIAGEKNIPIRYPKAGDMLQVDPSIQLFVLGPEMNASSSNPNNRSLVFKLVYGNASAIFTGDAEKEQEEQLAGRYDEFLQSDLYKAGHHGSNTSSTDSFINLVEPDITVASLAFENRFRHPGAEAVSRLHQYSKVQNYTSLNGAVIYQSDGNSFQTIKWR